MKRFRNAFVTGLLVLVPLMATVDILRWFIRAMDTAVRSYLPTGVLPFDFSGLGLLVALLIVFITGALTQNYVGIWLVRTFDDLIRRAPFVGGLYGGIKKLMETVFDPSNDQFQSAVLVEFPRDGMYSIGFRTGTPDPNLQVGKTKMVNVFFPMAPNPTSGFYVLVQEDKLIPLNIPVQTAFKLVVSMGIVQSDTPEEPKRRITRGRSRK